MSQLEAVSISLSKGKLVFLGICGVVFVVGGGLMLTRPDEEIRASHSIWPLADNPYFVHGVGLIAVIFFGLGLFYIIRKLLDKRPGLQLTQFGITNNASGVSAGLVPWSEIVGIEIYRPEIVGFKILGISGQKSLIVKVTNPEKYIEVGNPISRSLKRANYRMCGSPIAITSSALKIDFNKLVDLITKYRTNYSTNA